MILKIAYRGHLKGRCDIDDPEGNTLFSDVNITLAKRVVSCFNGCDGIENNELDEVSYSDLLQSHNYLQKQIANSPTVQREGWVSVPIEPDKARFIGEFSIDVTHHCSACAFHGAQDDCEVCSGKVEYVQKHTIPWTTFKKMYAEIISAAPTDTE